MIDYPIGHQRQYIRPGDWDEPDQLVTETLVDIDHRDVVDRHGNIVTQRARTWAMVRVPMEDA